MPFKSKYTSSVVSETTTRPTAPMSPLKAIESPSHSTSTCKISSMLFLTNVLYLQLHSNMDEVWPFRNASVISRHSRDI